MFVEFATRTGKVIVTLVQGGGADDLPATIDGCYPNPGDVVVTLVDEDAHPSESCTIGLDGALLTASDEEKALLTVANIYLKAFAAAREEV